MNKRIKILQSRYDVFEHCVYPLQCDVEDYKRLPNPLDTEAKLMHYRLPIINPIKYYNDEAELLPPCYKTFKLIMYLYKSKFCDNMSIGYDWKQLT